MSTRPLACLATLLLLAVAPLARADDATPLRAGETARGSLPDAGRTYRTYLVEVPVGAASMELELDASGDADLYLKHGGPIIQDWLREATAYGNGSTGQERVRLEAGGSPPLEPGLWYVDVVHAGGTTGAPLTYTLTCRMEARDAPAPTGPLDTALAADVEATFSNDVRLDVLLLAEGANYRTYRFEVAADVERVEIAVEDASEDTDLYIRHGAPMPDWETADHKAVSTALNERIVLQRTGVPRLQTGSYYLDVARGTPRTTRATLVARFVRGYQGDDVHGAPPEPSTEADVQGEIRRDALFTVTLDAESPPYRTYVIHVRKPHRSLLIKARGARTDVDLYLRHAAPILDYRADPDHAANGSRSDEQLYVDATSEPPLRPGRYYLDVSRASELDAGTLEVSVTYDAARPAPLPATSGPVRDVRPGERLSVDLSREGRKAGRYRLQVPRGARSLHVLVLKATRDVDLFLRHDGPVTSYEDPTGYDHRAVTARLNERIVIDETSTPPLRPGTWYLDAASLIASDRFVSFDLVVTLDEPAILREGDFQLPPFARGREQTPLERALEATVQIACRAGEGSGTCVTPDGLIITNHHVLEMDGDLVRDEIYVSFPRVFDQPPEQVLIAELVEADAELDVALLRVVRDVFDRPPPATMRLPWLPLGRPELLRHGDMLWVAGYPAVGGTEHRSSVTVTRGVVGGFTARTDGLRTWIKTDARISAGNSGGAALGPSFDYVGIPSMERVDEDDEMGYCRPVTMLPDAWRRMIRNAQERAQR